MKLEAYDVHIADRLISKKRTIKFGPLYMTLYWHVEGRYKNRYRYHLISGANFDNGSVQLTWLF